MRAYVTHFHERLLQINGYCNRNSFLLLILLLFTGFVGSYRAKQRLIYQARIDLCFVKMAFYFHEIYIKHTRKSEN